MLPYELIGLEKSGIDFSQGIGDRTEYLPGKEAYIDVCRSKDAARSRTLQTEAGKPPVETPAGYIWKVFS